MDRARGTVGPRHAEAGATPRLEAGSALASGGTRAPCGVLPHGVRVRESEEELPIVFVGGITHHQMLRARIDIS